MSNPDTHDDNFSDIEEWSDLDYDYYDTAEED